MKILYIGPSVGKIRTGGDSVNSRNEELLLEIFAENFNAYYITDPTNTVLEKLRGYLGGITKKIIGEVLDIISQNNIECVFLSQSFYGVLCTQIRKKYPSIKIITFYHNIETNYAKEYIKTNGLMHYPFYLLVTYNEKQTIKYSSHNIVLNERDANLMRNIYRVESDFSLPASYKDVFEQSKVKLLPNDSLKILFVGTSFFGNISGIELFIKEVMPHINAELIIVGKGMEQFREKFELTKNVKVFGFVDDLSAFYYNASVIIAPIFSGGGMKTKIAEALMYGKTIIGTREAFEGYKRKHGVTYECNSAKEFIDCINKMEKNTNINPFNIQARKIYEQNYDNKVLKIVLINFFNELRS